MRVALHAPEERLGFRHLLARHAPVLPLCAPILESDAPCWNKWTRPSMDRCILQGMHVPRCAQHTRELQRAQDVTDVLEKVEEAMGKTRDQECKSERREDLIADGLEAREVANQQRVSSGLKLCVLVQRHTSGTEVLEQPARRMHTLRHVVRQTSCHTPVHKNKL